MPRCRALSLAALALGVVIGSVSIASAAPSSTAQTLTLIAVDDPKREVYIDAGAKGEGPGDVLIFSELLHRRSARGEAVGRSEIVCIVVSRAGFRCEGTLLLPAGRLEAGGFVAFGNTPRFSVAILGGTRSYAGARGELVITSLGERRDRYVIRLLA